MANTFYKPKNEYGELLISEKDAVTIINNTAGDINNRIDSEVDELNAIISDTEKSLTDKINEADLLLNEKINDTNDQLNEKIDNVKKQATEHIIEVDEKHSLIIEEVLASEGVDPHEHFRITIERRWEEAIATGTLKQFAWGLAKTVFLIKNAPIKCDCVDTCACDDTFEEFICINPTKITEGEKPRFTRLGAVDSILATSKLPGSSILVSDIYHTSDWEDFSNNDKPIAGLSVAPIALRDFVHADTAISARLDARSAEIQKDIDAINDNLDHIRTELDGTIAEDGISGSRLDIIERVIGINGCCDNKETCSNKNHDTACEYCEPDCNIFCKINDINIRLEDNDRNDRELSAALDETNSNLDALSESTDSRFEETHDTITALDEKHVQHVEEIYSTINTKVEEINTSIDATNESLGSAHSRIDSLKKEHDALVETNRNEHNEIIGIIGANKAETVAKFYELDKVDAAQNSEIGRIEDKIEREINDRISLAGQYSDLNNRVNDLHTDCVSLRSDIDGHSAAADIMHTKLAADISKNAENLEIAKVQNASEHSIFASNIENSSKKLSELQATVTANSEYTQGEINSLRTRSTGSETKISNLEQITSELNDEVGNIFERLSTVKTSLDATVEQANDNAKDITSINARLVTAESLIATNNVERIKNIEDLANSLTEEVATRLNNDLNVEARCKQYSDELISQLTTSTDIKLAKKVDTETYETRVADVNAEINLIKKDISDHVGVTNTNFTAVNSRIDSLVTLQEKSQGDISRIDTQTSINTSDITDIKENISTNLQSINGINTQLETCKNDIATSQSDITVIRENVNTNTQSINTLNDAVETCKDNISSLMSADEVIKSDLDEIKDEFTEISTSFETLKNLVDTRQGNVNIFGRISLVNGNAIISKEKILNRIDAGEESNWIITVNSVQEESPEGGLEIIYPEIKYTSENIEITFGNNNINVLISFVGINTTNNDIITL